ncbi:hypothetical protein [Pedobacter flavus]|uniref:Tetratricopeptide repeat protein n=1 Tax=Pedobacter flavus TaxID=3113906 RepID=A0ABU7H193_9SPHI|nr:hypothetical protein [Pedobacter sp. VNH31]MEE1885103.1 hypothetical protein [Pedobacter sp. VNH31]
MYSAFVRYILLGFAIVAAITFGFYRELELVAASIFLFFFILWSHYRHSSVLLASKYFKNKDYENTQKYLNEVPNPDKLAKNRRGYYEFMLANIALQEEDFAAAEYHFQISSKFPLGGKNDKAYVMIHLANLALRNKDIERVNVYLKHAKELATTSKANELIQRIEKQVSKLS